MIISGTLKDSLNNNLSYCEIYFQSLDSGDSVGSNMSFRTSDSGFYSETILYGSYKIFIRYRDSRNYYLLKDAVTIDDLTPNQALNDLIL